MSLYFKMIIFLSARRNGSSNQAHFWNKTRCKIHTCTAWDGAQYKRGDCQFCHLLPSEFPLWSLVLFCFVSASYSETCLENTTLLWSRHVIPQLSLGSPTSFWTVVSPRSHTIGHECTWVHASNGTQRERLSWGRTLTHTLTSQRTMPVSLPWLEV